MPDKDTEQHRSDKPEGDWKPLTTDGAVSSEAGDGEPLHLVLDDIKDYAVFMVSLEGRIASWNTGAERLKGYTSKGAIGRPFAMLFTTEDVEQGRPEKEMRQALEKGIYQGEGIRVKKDGSLFYAEVTLRLIHDRAGRPSAFVKVTRDVTERKQLERAAQERSDFEKELLGIVSHDLRNPLNAILLSATMLMQRAGTDARQFQSLERIISSAQRASRLVRDLLDFTQARLGSGLPLHRTRFESHEFIRQVVEEIRLVHPEREIRVEESGEGTVEWDSDRIAQLITNLLNNALKHGANSRPVRVTTRGSGDLMEIEVHNWGEPIPENLMPHLFERLTQGPRDNAGGGSIGLGLFIVNLIVRAHGGTVKVQSTRDEGTCFTVRMPRTGCSIRP